MNNSRNNTLVIAIVAVLVAVLIAMCACMFGLAVGVGIGQVSAQLRTESSFETQPGGIIPVRPEVPDMPDLPTFPEMPAMPGMPDLDQLMRMMSGAMVGEVTPGGPAEQAGIQPGDLIIAIDGVQITPDMTLPALIGAHAPGDEVTVTIVRMGQGDMSQKDIVVVLDANPDDDSIGFLGVRVVPFFSEEEPDSP